MQKPKTKTIPALLTSTLVALLPVAGVVSAQNLVRESFTISSGAGGSGAAQTSCMISSDGTSWSGGVVGVQGAASVNNLGSHALAANVTFKYNVGSAVDSLNASYGAGHWTLANPKLTVQYTLYANNSRFNAGAGTFGIYWVGNDTWVQGSRNPVYATDAETLTTWAPQNALLATEQYGWSTPTYTGTSADLYTSAWTTDKTGIRQATLSYSLGLDTSFVRDITAASAGSDPDVSLYLMSTSDTLGLTIFTGGGQSLPTLSFDVVSVPEPSALALVVGGLAGLIGFHRGRK